MAAGRKTTHESIVGHCECAVREDGAVLRCECGSLLARYVDGQLELKCRRCKRTVTLPLELTRDPETFTR